MKSLITLVLFSTLSSAYACPQLAGSYKCSLYFEKWNLEISQYIAGSITHYNWKLDNIEELIVVDGITHNIMSNTPDIVDATYRANCKDQTLKVTLEGTMIYDDAFVSSKIDTQYSKDKNGNLLQVSSGTVSGYPIPTQKVTCISSSNI